MPGFKNELTGKNEFAGKNELTDKNELTGKNELISKIEFTGIRQKREDTERKILSFFAMQSVNSRGRERDEEKCSIRTDFQRDKDRIIYSKAFRRLKHKTQVFISPEGDHYRTRLTHTIEVTQIARTISRALDLNEDLTEAIALGHDIGHTPFGHCGERTLDEICKHGFRHNEQAIRIATVLEKEKGLNLTFEVLDGIVNHAGENQATTLEGRVVKFADRIAYINHDIEDAIRGGLLKENQLPGKCTDVLGKSSSSRINNMIVDIIRNSSGKPIIKMSNMFAEAMMELRKFLFDNVYIGSVAKKEEQKAQNIISSLYSYFLKDINSLPGEYLKMLDLYDAERVVCDYIAGMTDRYAVKVFSDINIPESWRI